MKSDKMEAKQQDKSSWNHPDCRYDGSPGKDGRRQAVGTYTDGKSYFAFSLHEQASGEYIMRGTVSLRSVRDYNRVLKCKSEDGTEKLISVPIRVRSVEESDIKTKIVQVCTKLAAENYDVIYKDLKSARPEDLTLATAVHLYGKDFMAAESRAKPESYDTKIREIMRIAIQLERYTLPEIPVSALIQVKKETGASSDAGFSQLCKFVGWIGRKHYYRGPNPFAEYYKRHPKKTPKSLSDIQDEAFRPQSLPDDILVSLRQKIAAAPPEDEKTSGLLLVHQAGLSAAAACAVHWGDLEFDTVRLCESTCVIKLTKENGGATQDYTHPVFPFGAEELRRRYLALKEHDPLIDQKKILAHITNDQLTAYCRTELQRLGVSYSMVAAAKGRGTMGGGVQLLLEDYANTLTHYCGIRSDATVRFLQSKSLKFDISADNYSSSSCPMGQERIQRLMERDTRFLPKPSKAPIVVEEENGKKTVTVLPDDPRRFTQITLRKKLEKGEQFSLYSCQGLQVTVKTV